MISDIRAVETQTVELPDKAVTRKVLDNGLTILARKSPPEGLAAVDIKILAGSSLEADYLGSGISHLVEHMIFKGTSSRGVGDIEREIKSYGGFINGSDSRDLTDYRIILPARYLPQALEILKDMLLNASFDAGELAKEKEVVLSEIRLYEDEPHSRLIKRLHETAYLRHPYRYPPIGYKEEFEPLERTDILSYYHRMYTPNRMVLSIVGDIDEAEALSLAAETFSDFRKPNYGIADILEAEPRQLSTRRLDEDSRVNLAYIALGFHSTSYLNDDLFAMDVLAMILGRGDGSRLNTELGKNRRLVHSISAWNHTPRDPGLFIIDAILDKENADKAEEAAVGEIRKLRTTLVTDEELAGAKRMALGDYIMGLETIDAQANDMGLSQVITGSPDFSRIYVDGIESVTKEDIKRVANKYLNNANMTVIRLLPELKDIARAGVGPTLAPDSIEKTELPNGLKVLVRKDDETPLVSITAVMTGGLLVETPSDNGISSLTAKMLLRGTKTRNDSQIQGFIERLGGDIDSFSGFNAFGVSIEILKPDLAAALDILKDILTASEFPNKELETEKMLSLSAIQEEDDDIFFYGINNLRKALFRDSPYGLRYRGNRSTVSALKREDLVAFYDRYCVANNIVISISGDIDPAEIIKMVRGAFSGLKKRDIAVASAEGPRLSGVDVRSLTMDKEQSLVLLGFETASIENPDRYSLEVLSSVLSGHSGRLFSELRTKRGLAYALDCINKSAVERGFLILYVACAKDNVENVKRLLLDEAGKIGRNGITNDELAHAKRELLGARMIARQTNNFYTLNSAVDELSGLGYDNLYNYENRIEKVSKDDVKRVASKYLDNDAYALVTVSSP